MPENRKNRSEVSLLLAANPQALVEYLDFTVPKVRSAGWYAKSFFMLLPNLTKLIGGGLTYGFGVLYAQCAARSRGSWFYRGLALLPGAFFLLLRAVFLPSKSMQDASTYTGGKKTRYALMALSGLITSGAWAMLAVFALPAALNGVVSGIGFFNSGAAAAVSSFFSHVLGTVGSSLPLEMGATTTEVASFGVGALMPILVYLPRVVQASWAKLKALFEQSSPLHQPIADGKKSEQLADEPPDYNAPPKDLSSSHKAILSSIGTCDPDTASSDSDNTEDNDRPLAVGDKFDPFYVLGLSPATSSLQSTNQQETLLVSDGAENVSASLGRS